MPSDEGRGQEANSPKTYTEIFRKSFPQYLAIGMTPEQYWDQDCALVVAYRKAEEYRIERRNQEFWLQGMYIYEALCDVAPIFRSFGKKGTKAHKYPAEPYSITPTQRDKEQARKEKIAYEKGMARMKDLANKINKQKSEVSANANDS